LVDYNTHGPASRRMRGHNLKDRNQRLSSCSEADCAQSSHEDLKAS